MLSSITREFAALLVFYRIKGLKDGFDLDYRIYIYSAHCHLFATLTTRQATALKPCDIVKKNAASAQSSLYTCILNIIHILLTFVRNKTFYSIFSFTNGDEAVDVAAPVQRIKGDDVATLPLSLHLDLVIILLQHRTVDIIDGSILYTYILSMYHFSCSKTVQ